MIQLLLPNGQLRQVEEGTTLAPLAAEFSAYSASPLVEALYNGRDFDLNRPLTAERELNSVAFVELNTEDGMRVYVRTLLFMFLVAMKRVAPQVQIEVRNTLGSALYCCEAGDTQLTAEQLAAVSEEMLRMAAARLPLLLKRLPKAEALASWGGCCSEDRLALLEELPEDALLTVNYLDGEPGYFFGSLCPDTGFLQHFELLPYDKGVVINYPDVGAWNVLPPFNDRPMLHRAFEETEDWVKLINCGTIGKLNKIISAGYADKIIQIAEALHEKKLVAIADEIARRRDELKLVLIAGPSSSGKTSMAQRLSIQLAVNGIIPMAVSMDDYYKNRVDTPKKPDGTYDFESIEAVDLELFNDHLTRLLAGESVKLPKYNFRTGWREYRGREMKMHPDSVLVVEGIHGLNEKLTASVPAAKKMKLYVSALTPMNLDEHNRINTTDVRLLRRMVRDSQFRARDARETLLQWNDVRYGEEKYIFPYQDSADIVFNTTLIYELAVLKKYALPHLQKLTEADGPMYATAQRLLGLLSFVKSIDDEVIPNNSILREFIGGSVFKEAL